MGALEMMGFEPFCDFEELSCDAATWRVNAPSATLPTDGVRGSGWNG